MLSSKDVLESLDEQLGSPIAIQAVLATKAQKREKKGTNLAAYSLDTSAGYLKPIAQFVDLSLAAVRKTGQPQRFQLAIKTSLVHWTAVDLIVTPNNGVKMLNVDAVGDLSGGVVSVRLYAAYKKKYPPNANESSFFYLEHNEIPGTDIFRNIQYDEKSCAIFALDILFHLANIEPIPLLEATKDKFRTSPNRKGEFGFDVTNMPVEMAHIYRNTQSKTVFFTLPPQMLTQVINKKGETLQSSEARHTGMREHKGVSKPSNYAIEHKRDGFIQDTQQFLAADKDALRKIENRDALIALEKGTFKPNVHLASVVGHMTAQAKKERSFFYHMLTGNSQCLELATRELTAGNLQQALSHLDTMKGMSQQFKDKLLEIKTNSQKQADQAQSADQSPLWKNK